MKILVCPDKFKGSLTAIEVCNAIESGIKSIDGSIEVVKLPLADGGEGTLDLLEAVLDLKRQFVTVNDPLHRRISVYYLKNHDTAYIEMSKASGLQLLKSEERNPLLTSTFGTGELIAHALGQGVKEIHLLIGGSATNDGGIGMANALGYDFLTKDGEKVTANGAGLSFLNTVDSSKIHEGLNKVKFTVLSDVQNPLTGSNGASYVYGGQKGANEADIIMLDKGLAHLAKMLNNGMESKPGAGAAGGLGYGAMSFLNAKIESGIDGIMRMLAFENHLKGADLIITGEGKMDDQTASGKVISGVSGIASSKNIPIGIICGIQERYTSSVDSNMVYQLMDLAKNLDDSMLNAKRYTEQLAFQMITDFR